MAAAAEMRATQCHSVGVQQVKRLKFYNATFAFLLLYFASLWSFAMAGELPGRQVESLVKQSWIAIQKEQPGVASRDASGQPTGVVGWQYVVSPPFPCEWPPNGQGQICYYAYASGQRFGLVDAEVIAAPWGRVLWDATGKKPPRIEVLGKVLKEAGVQGVRPLLQQEIAVYQTAKVAEAKLLLLSRTSSLKSDAAPTIRRYYCRWSKDNGVAVGQIQPLHPGFFNWLDCK
jgi:hypothetical protein